ncbi:MAG: response regulator [Halobacteriovoraceae bacterium]|nr:response regulator [Halobacteriovoraceae bacterium]
MTKINAEVHKKSLNILIVEDEDADIALVRRVINKSNTPTNFFPVRTVAEARKFLENNSNPVPDLIFLDINMPGERGTVLLEELKTIKKFKNTTFVMLTSSELEDDKFESFQWGADCYMNKPIDLGQIQSVFNDVNKLWMEVPEVVSYKNS